MFPHPPFRFSAFQLFSMLLSMPTPDEWSEAEATAEEALPQAHYASAAEGMAAMKRRLEYLRKRHDALMERLNEQHDNPELGDSWKRDGERLIQLAEEITQAELRLADYTRLHEGRN